MRCFLLCFVITANQVVDDIRMTNTFINLLLISQIEFQGDDLTQITSDLEMPGLICITIGNNNLCTLLGYSAVGMLDHGCYVFLFWQCVRTKLVDNVATQETSTTKDGGNVAVGGGSNARQAYQCAVNVSSWIDVIVPSTQTILDHGFTSLLSQGQIVNGTL